MEQDAMILEHHSDLDDEYGMTSDVEDPDVFDAVFPQAPELVRHHELLPLVHCLKAMIARPSELFAVLLRDAATELEDDETGNWHQSTTTKLTIQPLAVLDSKIRDYEAQQLGAIGLSWQAVVELVCERHRARRHDGWASPQLVRDIDAVMKKLTLYFIRLWRYLTMIVIGVVHHVESTIVSAHFNWMNAVDPSKAASMSPQYDKVATNPRVELRVRPLRLRSTGRPSTSLCVEMEAVSPVSSPVSESSLSSSSRRSRLARQSNEFMTAWFLAHKTNPYPSAIERQQIADKTGLTEQQVRNWFANMRKRHWKPKSSAAKKPRSLLDMLLRQDQQAS